MVNHTGGISGASGLPLHPANDQQIRHIDLSLDNPKLDQIFTNQVSSSPDPVVASDLRTVPSPEEIERNIKEIEGEAEDLEELSKDKPFQVVLDKKEGAETAETVSSIIQDVVAEAILKGGADAAKSLSGIYQDLIGKLQLDKFEIPKELLEGMEPVLEGIKVGADTVSVATGVISHVIKSHILIGVLNEIVQIRTSGQVGKTKRSDLTDVQRARFAEIEKKVRYEIDQLDMESLTLGLNSVKTFFTAAVYLLSLADKVRMNKMLVTSLEHTVEALSHMLTGVDVAFSGLFFYLAHKNLRVHREWSKEFNDWVEAQKHLKFKNFIAKKITDKSTDAIVYKIIAPKDIQGEVTTKVNAILTSRKQRNEDEIKHIKEELERGKITKEKIVEKVSAIKLTALQEFIDNPSTKHLESAQFQEDLARVLETDFDAETADTFHNESQVRNALKESINSKKDDLKGVKQDIESLTSLYEEQMRSTLLSHPLSSGEGVNVSKVNLALETLEKLNQAKLKSKEIQQSLKEMEAELDTHNHLIKDLLQKLISAQNTDDLLKTYVDYHAILDPTIKSSLSEMVQKKQGIQANYLKMSNVKTGVAFTAATIVFAVAVAFFIIGLVATPIGAAVLILTILGIATTVLGLGLTGAGYIQAFKENPGETRELFKGAFIRLKYYHVRAALSSLNEKIGKFITTTILKRKVEDLTPVSQITHKDAKDIDSDIREAKTRSEKWKAKADELDNRLKEIRWKDFADQAQLKVASKKEGSVSELESFDTLETFNHLLTTCDLTMLSEETQELLEKQLGINIHLLQIQINKDKNAVKQILRDFFNMDEGPFTKFIAEQQFFRPKQNQQA